jgi:hypothetical protein
MRHLFFFLVIMILLSNCKDIAGGESIKVDPVPEHEHGQDGPEAFAEHKHYYGYYVMKVDSVILGQGKFDSIISKKNKYRFTKNKLNSVYFSNKSVEVYKVVDSINQDTILVPYNSTLSNNRMVNNKDSFVPSIPKGRGRLGCIPAFEFEDLNNEVIIIHELSNEVDSKIVTFYVADHRKINKEDSTALYLYPVKFKIDFNNFDWLNSAFKNSKKLEGGLEGNFGSLPKNADQLDLFVANGGRNWIVNLIPIP